MTFSPKTISVSSLLPATFHDKSIQNTSEISLVKFTQPGFTCSTTISAGNGPY